MQLGDLVAARFELCELAQAGGMGAVYRARDRVSGAAVAVKILRAGGAGAEQRFLQEAALLADLTHPAIVRHIAHGRTPDGELFLAMEWLEGEDLARRLARGPLPVDAAVELIRQVTAGLAELHARGGVHRDLKPANLFLEGGRPDRVKILDFGIARATAAMALTRTGVIIGTPGYTAPEQARGDRDVDARANLFSLGCVLFECLAGRPAFRGDHIMAVLARILLEEPPRLGEVAPTAPPELETLVARLLEKDASRRPKDAGELLGLLDALAAGPAGLASLGPLTPRPPTLGTGEQRFMCLVLVAGAEHGSLAAQAMAKDDTLAGTPTPQGPRISLDTAPTIVPDSMTGPGGLEALVRSHGARLDRLADGSWVITPARGPATDQAAQAARVALSLRRALPGARVAMAAGRGLVAGRVPVGEVIDRTLGLLGPPGPDVRPGVGIDALSAGLLGARFELREVDGVLRLIGERDDDTPARRVLGREVAFVGRERELANLHALFDECVAEDTARAALVRGAAGTGKSRLGHELLARLRTRGAVFLHLMARGEPMVAGAPFALAGQVVRRAAGLQEDEPAAVQQARLVRLVAAVPEADRSRVRIFLGELTRVPAAHVDAALAAARRDAMVMGDQIRRAFEDWLAAEAATRPVILVLEDLHLGDLPTVKLIDQALRHLRDRPFFVLALARPEVHQLFPGLWADRPLQELPLPELSRRAATHLVRDVLGAGTDDATVARVVAQGGGNAFYLEELCRVMAGGGPERELPGTVLAMAQARLEALEAPARRLLRAAAVLGDPFVQAGVLALWGEAHEAPVVERLLAELVDKEVLEVRRPAGAAGTGGTGGLGGAGGAVGADGQSRTPSSPGVPAQSPERELGFRHALVREAAYAMLTDADRALGHRLAGEWLEARGGADPVLVAEHFARGGLPERAVSGYLRAAREALRGNDLAAVLARVERGLNLGARGEALGELLGLRAEAHRWRADYTAATESAMLSMATLAPGTSLWCSAATVAFAAYASQQANTRLDDLLARALGAPRVPGAEAERVHMLAKGAVQFYLLGRYDRGDELCARIEADYAALGDDDPSVVARVHEARAFREGARAEQGRALDELIAAASYFDRASDLRNGAMARNNLGYTYSQLGDYVRATQVLERTLAEAERLALPYVSTVVRQNLGVALTGLGHLERSAEIQRAALLTFRKQADQHMACVSQVYLAQLALLAGDAAGAAREASEAVASLGGNPPARALGHAVLARARVVLGDAAGALGPAREAYTLLESLGGLDEGEMFVRLAHAEALGAAGRTDEARAVTRVAGERLAALASKLDEPLRTMFLERVPENAALLALTKKIAL